jgi:phospholipase C
MGTTTPARCRSTVPARQGRPHYVLADHFFQAAFGGSFLNHQYLIAARAPIDTSGGGLGATTPCSTARDGPPPTRCTSPPPTWSTAADPACADGRRTPGRCGDSRSTRCSRPARRSARRQDPARSTTRSTPHRRPAWPRQVSLELVLRLAGTTPRRHPGPLFQYHHQPFNYFATTPRQAGPAPPARTRRVPRRGRRARCRRQLRQAVRRRERAPRLRQRADGSDHLVDLLKAITTGPQAKDTSSS